MKRRPVAAPAAPSIVTPYGRIFPAPDGILRIAPEERVSRMPQVVAAAAINWAFAAGYGLLLTEGVLAGITVLSYAVVVGAYYAYGTYQAKQARDAARSAFNASLKDRLVMTTTTDAPRSRCYGRVRNVDGVVFKNTHGSLKEFYTLVVALAGHEIDGVEQVWFNDVPIALDGSGYVTTSPWAFDDPVTPVAEMGTFASGIGSVTLPHAPNAGSVSVFMQIGDATPVELPFTVLGNVVSYSGGTDGYFAIVNYQYTNQTRNARVRAYLGAPGQDLSGALIALGCPDATTAHKFQGIACLLVTLTYSVDSFPSGVPNISAVFRGAKIYDPRTATMAWSRNPALIARDWAIYAGGGGALAADIDNVIGNASANACDVVQIFTRDAGGVISLPTYVCDIVAPTQTDPTQTLNEIVASMAGKYAWCGGILRIKAGAYTAPVATIDESWLSGAETIDITAGVSRVDLVNSYRPTIADAASGYVTAPIEAVRATAYITADGVELPRDITLMGVSDPVHAQHICGVLLRDARQALTVKLPCNNKAYPVEVFDTVAVTLSRYGWTAKEFEVVSYSFSPTGGIVLTLKETVSTIWTPAALFTTSDNAPNTSLPLPWVVPVPTGLVLSSGSVALTDGSIIVRVLAEWDATPSESVRQSGTFELQWMPAAGGEWVSAPAMPGDAVSTIIVGPNANTAVLFRLRAINSLGVRSAWSLQVLHIVAQAASVIPDWTDVVGRPALFRVMSVGSSATSYPSGALGLTNGETGATLGAAYRSYTLCKIRRSDGVVVSATGYDVYASSANAAALAAALNATTSDYIVVVYGYDEPFTNRLGSGLAAAMYRCGASPAVFGSPQFKVRSAYVLIGIGGCGQSNGFESYHGAVDNDPNAWVDAAFQVNGGNLIVTGSGATPGTLPDFGYTGTLDATTDISLIARGQCVVAGNYASKVGGTSAWDSDVYSRDSATFACMVSAVVVDMSLDQLMFGLNSDPTTDQNWTSLDYCWYVARTVGALGIYESGAGVLAGIAAAVGDVLAVIYDGSNVRYLLNGIVVRTVTTTAGRTFFFDSSFQAPGAALRNIRFGALSANDWASIGNINVTTGQLAANAATEIYVVNPSAVTVVNAAFTPDGYARNTLIAQVTFTPSHNGTAQAFFDGRGTYTNSAGFVASPHWSIQDANGSYQGSKRIDGNVSASASGLTLPLNQTRAFPVVAGVAQDLRFYAAKGDTADTFVIDNIEMRVEVVKR